MSEGRLPRNETTEFEMALLVSNEIMVPITLTTWNKLVHPMTTQSSNSLGKPCGNSAQTCLQAWRVEAKAQH